MGQYATAGMRVFALIDTTAWWVLGNFKETQLHHIAPGMPADVFLMTRPDIHFHGVIQSIGFGVSPPDNTGAQSGTLPSINRTLNWVRLAQRFPCQGASTRSNSRFVPTWRDSYCNYPGRTKCNRYSC